MISPILTNLRYHSFHHTNNHGIFLDTNANYLSVYISFVMKNIIFHHDIYFVTDLPKTQSSPLICSFTWQSHKNISRRYNLPVDLRRGWRRPMEWKTVRWLDSACCPEIPVRDVKTGIFVMRGSPPDPWAPFLHCCQFRISTRRSRRGFYLAEMALARRPRNHWLWWLLELYGDGIKLGSQRKSPVRFQEVIHKYLSAIVKHIMNQQNSSW